MNFMTQICDKAMGHGFNQPVNFHLKPDHFHHEGNGPKPTLRRHTFIGTSDDVTASSGSRQHLQLSRPASTLLDLPMDDLSCTGRSHSASFLNNIRSLANSRSCSRSHVQDEGLEQLLPEGEDLLAGHEYRMPSNTEYLPPDHDCRLQGCQRAVINVSGLRFETQLRTLDRLPNTLLGNPEKRRKYWDEQRQEFFFDRHRPTFQAVLYYYQSGGRLKRPLEVPTDIFLNELMFYELGGSAIDSFKLNEGYIVEGKAPVGPSNKMMHKIWLTLEYPDSSLVAKIVAILSVMFILVSVVTFCIETLPQFQSVGCVNVSWVDGEGRVLSRHRADMLQPLFIIESCCMLWFVMELGLRLVVSPSKLDFFRATINWIDLIAITPYFIFLALNFAGDDCSTSGRKGSMLRVLRVVRILKLSKHSEGLKILGMTLKTSIRELSMFVLFLGIATVIFSGAIYYAELGLEDSQFTSIPDAFWWAIVSMTTVGYGDFVPKGFAGKLLGGVCVLSGVLAIALPVPVIVANFNNYYRHYTGRGYR